MSRLILVLGPHRCGTSLIAQSLECLGAQLGPRSRWSGPDNPNFAEDQDVLATNESLLAFSGTRWSDMPLGPLNPMAVLDAERVGTQVLRKRLAEFPVFALKEPRLCRLLPVWRPVFAALDVSVSVVFAVRHPTAAALSLVRRNRMTVSQGLELWADHIRLARADACPDWPSVTVDYDRLVDDPHLQVMRLGRKLGMEVDRDALGRFWSSSRLRHHHPARLAVDLPEDVANLWNDIWRESRS